MPSGKQYTSGDTRERWHRLFDDSTATSALVVPGPSASRPTGYIIDTGKFSIVRLVFYGTDAHGEIIDYQVVGWQRYGLAGLNSEPTCWMPRVLAEGAATLGTKTLGAGGAIIGTSTDLFADTITDSVAISGSSVVSEANNSIAWINVDCSNCELLEVETDINTAAKASCIYQLGD